LSIYFPSSIFPSEICFVLPIIVYTLSSAKLKIRAEQFLPGSEGVGETGRGGERGRRPGVGERNDTNIVCT
jgi:hypothetical protein